MLKKGHHLSRKFAKDELFCMYCGKSFHQFVRKDCKYHKNCKRRLTYLRTLKRERAKLKASEQLLFL